MQFFPLLSTGAALLSQTTNFAVQSFRAIRDPTDGDAVSAVGELSSLEALEHMKNTMMADKHGRSILKAQPAVTDDLLEFARSLPSSTFGFHYASYMDHNKFLPSGRTPVKHIANPTLSYVMTRYRQCHDFLHTVTGCGRTVEEELAVKLLEWQHTGLPLGLLAIPGGAPHLTPEQRRHMAWYWTWAKENAPTSTHAASRPVPMYLNVPWEKMLDRPLEEVHRYTGIVPLAQFLEAKKKEQSN